MKCACPDGYQLSETDAKTCKDIDECLVDKEVELSCRASGGYCHNTPGSFQCICPEGFRSAGKTCAGTHIGIIPITKHASIFLYIYFNFLFSFEKIRYKDIDECAESSPCTTACTNLPGSYRCDCDDGFESLNGTCTGMLICNKKSI